MGRGGEAGGGLGLGLDRHGRVHLGDAFGDVFEGRGERGIGAVREAVQKGGRRNPNQSSNQSINK